MTQALQGAYSTIEHFYHWEKHTPDRVFLKQALEGRWISMTYAEAGQEARRMCTSLRSMGLQKGDHVGILSKNCYHWILSDLAIMMGGFVSVPYYASLPKAQLEKVIQLSDLKALFVGKLDTWGNKKEAIPASLPVIRFPHYTGNAKIEIGQDWNEIIQQHEPADDNYAPDLDDLWTIKFTSGTTGTPKGVMHPHRNPAMIMENERLTNWIGIYNAPEIRTLSFLPLNHVAERIGIELPSIVCGGSISFAENINTFAKNLQDTQPTLFFAVPRIWNKFYLGILGKIPKSILNILFSLPVVNSFIKKKLKHAIGMADVKIAATGAAITPAFIKAFFQKLDIHLIEAYGMTEVCGSFTNGPSLDTPNDSVGQVIPGAEIKIAESNGEILMKTPYIMSGYYKEPAMTAKVLKDGWMYSGDRGYIDEQGFLRVIGRVSDSFKTSKGKYITPNKIEEGILANNYVEQVCLTGLGIPQPIALVNLSDIGKEADAKIVESSLLETLNQVKSELANFEKPSTIIIDATEWSEQNQMLTPTLKIRRGKINECYQDQFLKWHEEKDTVIWKKS